MTEEKKKTYGQLPDQTDDPTLKKHLEGYSQRFAFMRRINEDGYLDEETGDEEE